VQYSVRYAIFHTLGPFRIGIIKKVRLVATRCKIYDYGCNSDSAVVGAAVLVRAVDPPS
jgi:hypothetical protein